MLPVHTCRLTQLCVCMLCCIRSSARLHLLHLRSPRCHGDDRAVCCTASYNLIRAFSETHTVLHIVRTLHCGCLLMPAGAHDCNSIIQYSLCPTFMIIFMDLVLHTPPSWLSMPSMVPLDVATAERERWTRLELTVAASIWYRKDVLGKLCCHICPEPISEKQPVPKDNKGTESLPLRKDMSHTPFNKITIHPFITSVALLQRNISHPQSQLAWVIVTVISLTVLMGLMKEAVKGGEERGETERRKQRWLQWQWPSWHAAGNSAAYRALALTTLQRVVASY